MKFKNIIGEFEVSDELNLIKEFKTPADYENSKLDVITPENLGKFKGKFLKQFRNNNIQNTIIELKSSASKDVLIIQCSNNIDETNKVINLYMKRFSEWFSYFLPEVVNQYSQEKLLSIVLTTRREEMLRTLNIDEDESMGSIPEDIDYNACLELAKQVDSLYRYKEKQTEYLEHVMQDYCRNLMTIAGVFIGAKLISLGHGLKNIAISTASRIQLLGAEKALFRHLKTGAKSPKYGIIHEHPIVMKASQQNKGKVARALADKLSLAVKLDYFKGEFKGDELLKELENKFK